MDEKKIDSLWSGLLNYNPPVCRNPACEDHAKDKGGED